MTRMMQFATSLWTDDEGATAIEYGLLAALVSVIIVAASTAISTQVQGPYDDVRVIGATAATSQP